MARDKALWAKIRADFLATGKSYPELAAEYGVSISTLKKTAAREAWTLDKTQVDVSAAAGAGVKKRNRKKEPEPQRGTGTAKTEPEPRELSAVPTDEEIIDAKRKRLDTYFEVYDAITGRIYEAIMRPDVVSPYALKQLASAFRDLSEAQAGRKTELDLEEQRARIAKIRSETAIPESRDDKAVSIEFVDTYGAET